MTDRLSANESTFEPLEFSDVAFQSWACRTALRMKNLPPGCSDAVMQRAIVRDGTPSPAWAQALVFMLTLAKNNQHKAMTA